VHQAAIYSTPQTVIKSITNRLGSSIVIRFFACELLILTQYTEIKIKKRDISSHVDYFSVQEKRCEDAHVNLQRHDKDIYIHARSLHYDYFIAEESTAPLERMSRPPQHGQTIGLIQGSKDSKAESQRGVEARFRSELFR
jgi:hypothetical protein